MRNTTTATRNTIEVFTHTWDNLFDCWNQHRETTTSEITAKMIVSVAKCNGDHQAFYRFISRGK
jgi:hypothetical protein